jgi:hypothetical protein
MIIGRLLVMSESTQRRDKHRGAEQLKLLELTRTLSLLARQHERFAPDINRLVMRVKYQGRSPIWKRRLIVRAFGQAPALDPLSLEEICEQTVLDRTSVARELAALVKRGVIEVVDRHGQRSEERHQGGKFRQYYRARSRVLTSKIPERR